jgi:hypothetical protein
VPAFYNDGTTYSSDTNIIFPRGAFSIVNVSGTYQCHFDARATKAPSTASYFWALVWDPTTGVELPGGGQKEFYTPGPIPNLGAHQRLWLLVIDGPSQTSSHTVVVADFPGSTCFPPPHAEFSYSEQDVWDCTAGWCYVSSDWFVDATASTGVGLHYVWSIQGSQGISTPGPVATIRQGGGSWFCSLAPGGVCTHVTLTVSDPNGTSTVRH